MKTTRANSVAAGLFLTLGLLSQEAAAGIDDLQGTGPGDLPEDDKFASIERCSGCHRAAGPEQERDYMAWNTFPGTMMANAWRDPVFQAALTVANQDAPGVGTFCLRCHTPIGFVRGRATPPDGSALDPDPSEVGIVDGQGVGCDVCHRAVSGSGAPEPYLIANAQLFFGYELNEEGAIMKYGPYEDVRSQEHGGKQDQNLASSRFCGQCHQVTNPDVMMRDANGTPTTIEFPLDTTYEEWAASDFRDGGPDAKSCIDCHMRRKIGDHPVTKFGEPLRKDPRDHVMVGGNHWGIQAVMAADPERAMNYASAFELALERTLESLASAASVTLVQAPAQAAPGDPIQVTVRVENLAGHKFPTGYAESRRAWIAVTLVDQSGTERTLLGGYDDVTGEIQHDPPTHEYRAVHGRWDESAGAGKKEEHLALHDMIISDTRIPPKGFVPSETTMPTSEIDFGDGNGGYRNYDEATFTLTIPTDAVGVQTLEARVYYQAMTKEYIEFLRSENTTDNKGELLHDIYQATGEAPPILVASADAPIDLGSPPDSTGGGGPDTGKSNDASDDSGGCGIQTRDNARAGCGLAGLAGLALASAAARRRSRRGR